MIVVTLVAHAIARGPMILTECKMAQLSDGDRLLCEPDFATSLLTKYPHNLKSEGHKVGPEALSGGRWQLQKAGEAPPPSLADRADDRSLASPRNRAKGKSREASVT